jgi:hypothetical protein
MGVNIDIPLFGWAYQHGLSAGEQCFSLTENQPQPAYKPKKQPAEQGYCWYANILWEISPFSCFVKIMVVHLCCYLVLSEDKRNWDINYESSKLTSYKKKILEDSCLKTVSLMDFFSTQSIRCNLNVCIRIPKQNREIWTEKALTCSLKLCKI